MFGGIVDAQRREVPMTPDRWEPLGNAPMAAEFKEVMGSRAVVLKSAIVLKDLTFRNGTIEYDVVPEGMGAGLGFRSPNNETAEILYFRPKPNCAQAFDCAQYTPLSRGVLLWDMFPQHQSPAPLRAGAWNHVKVVASGQRMRVFVNKAATPTLEIGRLEGDALEGRLILMGPRFLRQSHGDAQRRRGPLGRARGRFDRH
jgi:hypothetical protein